MNETSRRSVLKALLGGVLQAAGAVVLARATLASSSEAVAAEGVTQRADRLAEALPTIPPDDLQQAAFSNAAFRNSGGGGGGGFRNGGFANGGGGGGAFKNGTFRN
jgi:3-oxoacyl-(acyl-carrier-protein) synthase